jgi:hypothetical protein
MSLLLPSLPPTEMQGRVAAGGAYEINGLAYSSAMTLSSVTLSITTFSINDTQQQSV